MKNNTNPETELEVQLRKTMTYKQYMELLQTNLKGWKCQAFQKGILNPIKTK